MGNSCLQVTFQATRCACVFGVCVWYVCLVCVCVCAWCLFGWCVFRSSLLSCTALPSLVLFCLDRLIGACALLSPCNKRLGNSRFLLLAGAGICSIQEATNLYDQLAPVCPIVLALSGNASRSVKVYALEAVGVWGGGKKKEFNKRAIERQGNPEPPHTQTQTEGHAQTHRRRRTDIDTHVLWHATTFTSLPFPSPNTNTPNTNTPKRRRLCSAGFWLTWTVAGMSSPGLWTAARHRSSGRSRSRQIAWSSQSRGTHR